MILSHDQMLLWMLSLSVSSSFNYKNLFLMTKSLSHKISERSLLKIGAKI